MTANGKKGLKKIAKRLLAVLFAVIIAYGVYIYFLVQNVKKFREYPYKSFVDKYIPGNLPHQILVRALIFKPGTPEYNNTIRIWVYGSDKLSDNIWNRWILERDVKRMTIEELSEHLPYYPLSPDNLVLQLKQVLYKAKNGYEVLPVLKKTRDGNGIGLEWIEEKIFDKKNYSLFIKSLPYIASLPDIPMDKYLNTFWNKIVKKKKKEKVFSSIMENLNSIMNSKTASSFSSWLFAKLKRKKIKIDDTIISILGIYMSSSNKFESRQAVKIIKKEWKNFGKYDVQALTKAIPDSYWPTIIKTFFNDSQRKKENPIACLELFLKLISHDMQMAEKYAVPVLRGQDSKIRKGIIVLLVNGGSDLGERYLDDAFKGNARRIIMFYSPHQYIYGSEATDWYCQIAGHDYLETGKTWPPYGVGKKPLDEEIDQWKQFIKTYPWFPGTDDAYYRMAYCQLSSGRLRELGETIQRFASIRFSDDDARIYVAHLIREMAFLKKYRQNRYLYFLNHVNNIQHIHRLIFITRPNITPYRSSVKWMKRNPNFSNLLNIDLQVLKHIERILKKIRTLPYQQRLWMIMLQLGKESSAKWLVPLVFYGRGNLSNNNYTPMISKQDACYNNIRLAAQDLEIRIRTTRSVAMKRDYIVWSLLNYYTLPYPLNKEFKFALGYKRLLSIHNFPKNLRWIWWSN